jgi:hypothetical protein
VSALDERLAVSSQDIRFLASCIADPIRSFAFRFGLYACPNLTVRANGGEGGSAAAATLGNVPTQPAGARG